MTLQQECRRRASRKLAATLLCPEFRFPTALSAEQCTSDALAEIHAAMVPEGAMVLDMTCGLGIDAFHLARRAKAVTAIDIDREVAAAAADNARALGLDNVTALCADSVEWLRGMDERFDVIFIDPARRSASGGRVYSLADCQPNLLDILPLLREHAPRVIAKVSPMLDITHLLERDGLRPAAIHAVGTRSECKELVLDIRFDATTATPLIHAVTEGHPTFTFCYGQRVESRFITAPVAVGDIVAEPWPSVMKAGPVTLLPGERLDVNTHLWLNPAEEFPGDCYRVTRVEPFSSSAIRRLAKERPEGSVAVKNLPLTAASLSARIKARESSTTRIVAAATCHGNVMMWLTPVG